MTFSFIRRVSFSRFYLEKTGWNQDRFKIATRQEEERVDLRMITEATSDSKILPPYEDDETLMEQGNVDNL